MVDRLVELEAVVEPSVVDEDDEAVVEEMEVELETVLVESEVEMVAGAEKPAVSVMGLPMVTVPVPREPV